MKLTIKQHTNNLQNAKASLVREVQRYNSLGLRINELKRQVEFAELQLTTAVSQGRDGYDPDRFLRKLAGIEEE